MLDLSPDAGQHGFKNQCFLELDGFLLNTTKIGGMEEEPGWIIERRDNGETKGYETGRALHPFALSLIQIAMNWLIQNFFAINIRLIDLSVLRCERIAIDTLNEAAR